MPSSSTSSPRLVLPNLNLPRSTPTSSPPIVSSAAYSASAAHAHDAPTSPTSPGLQSSSLSLSLNTSSSSLSEFGLLPILALLTNCPGCKYIFLSIRITPACCKYYAFCKYSSACCKYYAAFCKYLSACCNYLCLFINSDYQMCKETKEATQEETPDCYLECEDS